MEQQWSLENTNRSEALFLAWILQVHHQQEKDVLPAKPVLLKLPSHDRLYPTTTVHGEGSRAIHVLRRPTPVHRAVQPLCSRLPAPQQRVLHFQVFPEATAKIPERLLHLPVMLSPGAEIHRRVKSQASENRVEF
ncbi:UNVERIFIED_CONTAM: hypothetical protein K2H54_024449 [Gekko kuhli]